jgi:hypothetical protein
MGSHTNNNLVEMLIIREQWLVLYEFNVPEGGIM